MDVPLPADDQIAALSALGQFIELATYRDLEELLGEALRLMVRVFPVTAGSLIYLGSTRVHVQEGELPEQAAEQVARWEQAVEQRLGQARWHLHTPHLPPVTVYPLPQDEGTLLNTPLLSQGRVMGCVSLLLPPGQELTPFQQQLLTRFVRGVGNLADLTDCLTVTQQRLSQLGLFYQMGQALVSTFDLNKLLNDIMELAVSVIDAGASSLMLIDEETQELVFTAVHSERGDILRQMRIPLDEGIAGWVATHGEPIIVNDVSKDPRFSRRVDVRTGFLTKSILGVPLQIKGKTIGVLEVLNKYSEEGFDEEDLRLMMTLAAQAAIAIENARLYQSLREERDRILKAQEDVRRELARNLHDGTVQLLAAISMGIDHVERLLQVKPEAVYAELDALRKLVHQAIRDTRLLLFELRPLVLESRGLVPALEAYVEQLRSSETFAVHLDTGGFTRSLDTQVAGAIFSIIQEAVTNVKKHAQARNVWIRLREDDGDLVVEVEDDGLGFNVAAVERDYEKRGSFGLLNMRERAALIDGTLTIESSEAMPDQGTLVTLRVPLKPPRRPRADKDKEQR